MITLIPFISEFSVSMANEFDAEILRLVDTGSFDINCTPVPFIIQANVFEFPVAQVQVTVSPGHTDVFSQTMKGASIDMKVADNNECTGVQNPHRYTHA